MNSKEALNNIKNLFIGSHINLAQQFEIIEKDLEVLDILKRMVMVRKGNTWYYLDTEHPFFESQEDIDKVKEWLNDK